MDEAYLLAQEIKALEREITAKQIRLLEIAQSNTDSTSLDHYLVMGTAGPTYVSELFSLHSELVLFHVMADCEFCDVWLASIEHLVQKLNGTKSLAIVSPQPIEELAQRAEAMDWTIPYYSTSTCDFSEDMGFLRPDQVGIAGIVVCQLQGDEVHVAAKAPFGPSPFCSMWIFADKFLRSHA